MGCYRLIPKFRQRFLKEKNECLLPANHEGYHLTKLNNGGFLSWGGYACDEDCGWCGECFNNHEIDIKTAREIMKGIRENFHDE